MTNQKIESKEIKVAGNEVLVSPKNELAAVHLSSIYLLLSTGTENNTESETIEITYEDLRCKDFSFSNYTFTEINGYLSVVENSHIEDCKGRIWSVKIKDLPTNLLTYFRCRFEESKNNIIFLPNTDLPF